MLLGRDVFADLQGGRVEHRDEFGDLACGQEAHGVGGALLGIEGEARGHVELAVQQHSLVVLVDDHPDLLAFPELGRHVDVVLLPVYVQLELYLVVHLRLQDEVIEAAAHEGVGADVGVSHVVLAADILLAPLHLLSHR